MVDRKEDNHRSNLTGEHPFGDKGQVILLFVFLTVWILDSFVFHMTTLLAVYVPLYVRIPISAVCLAAAVYFIKSGHDTVLGTVREIPAVIKENAFSRVRHPIYLGTIVIYLGFTVSTLSILTMIIWVIICFFYHFIAGYEEKLLLEKFGRDYEEYMGKVPMWIPRIRR